MNVQGLICLVVPSSYYLQSRGKRKRHRILYYRNQLGREWDTGLAGRNLDVGYLEGRQGTCWDFGQSIGSATCSMLLCGTSTQSLHTL